MLFVNGAVCRADTVWMGSFDFQNEFLCNEILSKETRREIIQSDVEINR